MLYGIYRETGIFTALAMALIMISMELISWNLGVLNENAKKGMKQ
jgi:hypothetical protein